MLTQNIQQIQVTKHEKILKSKPANDFNSELKLTLPLLENNTI